MSGRGYYGIALLRPKCSENVGQVLRSALAFDAAFVLAVEPRCDYRHATNTSRSERHIPYIQLPSIDALTAYLPVGCHFVTVERTEDATSLSDLAHPQRAIYLFGPEDGSVPERLRQRSCATVQMPSRFCLNLAVAASIVMYDRVRQ